MNRAKPKGSKNTQTNTVLCLSIQSMFNYFFLTAKRNNNNNRINKGNASISISLAGLASVVSNYLD